MLNHSGKQQRRNARGGLLSDSGATASRPSPASPAATAEVGDGTSVGTPTSVGDWGASARVAAGGWGTSTSGSTAHCTSVPSATATKSSRGASTTAHVTTRQPQCREKRRGGSPTKVATTGPYKSYEKLPPPGITPPEAKRLKGIRA